MRRAKSKLLLWAPRPAGPGAARRVGGACVFLFTPEPRVKELPGNDD